MGRGAMVGHHKELRVWQQSVDFSVDLYQATQSFPDSEKFGLRSQLRRAAVSIPSNIAEGAARGSAADYAHFLTIAVASASEVDTQLEISRRLGFLTDPAAQQLAAQVNEISHMLLNLRSSIRKRVQNKK